jgi:hypothetical protein
MQMPSGICIFLRANELESGPVARFFEVFSPDGQVFLCADAIFAVN